MLLGRLELVAAAGNAGIADAGHLTLHLIGDKSPSAACDSSEVERANNGRCYPHTENGELNRCLTRGPSLPVGFSIQDEAMDIARSASHGFAT